MVLARPSGPTWVTAVPIASSQGRTRSSAATSPPTMNEAWPCSTVIVLPETGTSSRAAPRALTGPSELADDGRAHRAHLDEDGARAQPGDDAVGAEGDRAQRGVVGHHA